MAHDIKSAGISVQVIDQTAYAAATAGTVAAAVGFAEKGPIDEPTLILSKEEYQNTFGDPIVDNYYLGLFADKFLDYSVGYFTRIAKEVDYEAITGTVLPGLDFSGIANPEMFIELAGYPEPNNGIYRITWAATTIYADVEALALAINTAFALVNLADGSTKLSAYVIAKGNASFLELESVITGNVEITVQATEVAAANVVKVTGAGHLGMADGASSAAVNNYSYPFVRVPIAEVAATAGAITGAIAITPTSLNTLSAWNKVNILVDNDGTNPYKTYEDVDIVPATGVAATFATLQAALVPDLTEDWTDPVTDTIDITLTGFYDFISGDATGDVNKTHTLASIAYDGVAQTTLSQLITALNNALAALATTSGTMDEYIKFAAYDTDKLQIIKGTELAATLFNLGDQCSILIEDGATTGFIVDLGYTLTTNDDSVGGNSTYTAEGVAAKITSVVTEATSSSATDIISITSNRTGTTSYIEIETATTVAQDALETDAIFDGIFTTGDSDTGSNSSNSGVANFVAKDAGTWGDNVKVRTYSSTNPITSTLEYYIEVFLSDDSVEVWGPVSWTDDTATNFVTTILENSNYIRMDFGETIEYPNTDTDDAPTSTPPNNADVGMPMYWQLAGGDDGIPSVSTEADALAILALDEYNDKEQYVIDLLVAPGFTGSAVINKLQSVGEARQDILAIVDPPPFLTYIEAIDWHNGSYTNGGGPSTSLTSSYTVFSWGWQRDFDAINEQYIDLPPSIYEAVAVAKTQKNYELWEAPAGATRGIVDSISSYTKPTAAQREYLYNDTDPACVNPIVQFPTEGVLIYGQKTCLKQNKATNRINVRRLVNNVVRNIESIGRRYIFELNNASTWASITREINSLLSNIQERGGLQAFSVIFDASTTTADRVDQGIMYGKVFIQPTRVAERIFIDLTIQRTGALATEV